MDPCMDGRTRLMTQWLSTPTMRLPKIPECSKVISWLSSEEMWQVHRTFITPAL